MCPLAMSSSPGHHQADSTPVYSLPIRSKYSPSHRQSASHPSQLLDTHDTVTPLLSSLVAAPDTDPHLPIADLSEDDEEDGAGQFSLPVTAPGSVDLSTSPEQPPVSSLAARRGFPTRSVKFDMAAVSFQNAPPFISPHEPTPQAETIPEWLQAAVDVVMRVLAAQELHGQHMRVLSQALPVPSAPGHCATAIVQVVRMKTLPTKLIFITMMHAIPGSLKLSDLPQTPPTTPGPVVGGDSYFSASVFDVAVPSLEYNEDNAASRMIREHYLSAPESVELSIVERYIPPNSAKEAISMFHLYGHSLVVDRLVELSPRGGCLLFNYPTKTGATTFQSRHLGPALTNTIRHISGAYGLKQDFAMRIDQSPGLEDLVEFSEMAPLVRQLLLDLNNGVPAAADRLRGRPAGFELVYAEAHEVEMDASVWVDWWIKENKQRIRDAVADYFRHNPPQNVLLVQRLDMSVENVVRQLFEGVEKRALASSPSEKIEVGVFVIKRSGDAVPT